VNACAAVLFPHHRTTGPEPLATATRCHIWWFVLLLIRPEERVGEAFVQAFALPGVQLLSLQMGRPRRRLVETQGSSMIDLAPLLKDFADTAAAIAELDLVIMTDSAVAHLAGAMGKPCWVLLNPVPFWLWFRDRADSPWYSSVRLFRARTWMAGAACWTQPQPSLRGLWQDVEPGAGVHPIWHRELTSHQRLPGSSAGVPAKSSQA